MTITTAVAAAEARLADLLGILAEDRTAFAARVATVHPDVIAMSSGAGDSPKLTVEGVRSALLGAFCAPHDPADPNPAGFVIRVPDLMDDIVVELRGVDLLEHGGPGSWPRALINGYARVLERAGYSVRVVVNDVIVSGVKS